MDAFAEQVWDNLNEDNKVSLFVRYTDLATGSVPADIRQQARRVTREERANMKELELKYGCNPNQKPAQHLSWQTARDLPLTVLNGTPGLHQSSWTP